MNYKIKEYYDALEFEDEYNCYDFDVVDFVFSSQKSGKGYIIILPIEFSFELEELFNAIVQSNSIISFKNNDNSTIIAIDSF